MADDSDVEPKDDSQAADCPLWEAPDKRFTKVIVSKGFGFYCPQDGSVCKIKVIRDEEKIFTDVNNDMIKELIVGDVDDPIERILEACIRTMKNEEVCILQFPDPLRPNNVNNGLTSPDLMCSEPLWCKEKPPDCDKANAVEDQSEDPSKANVEDSVIEGDDLNHTENQSDNDAEVEKDIEKASKCSEESAEAGSSGNGSSEKCDSEVKELETVVKEESPIATESPVDAKEMSCDNEDKTQPDEDILDSESLEATMPKMYEVELQLISYTREPEVWEMSITEKWRRANYHKQKGMELYARGSYEWAFRRFGLSLKYVISLEHDIPSGHEEGMNITGLKLSCYLNLAACQMRHHNYSSVTINCTKALELQADNSKALYRRGAAYLQLQDYEKAKEDLDKAFEMEPKNQAIVKQQQLLKARVQKLNQYYASAMKKMFS